VPDGPVEEQELRPDDPHVLAGLRRLDHLGKEPLAADRVVVEEQQVLSPGGSGCGVVDRRIPPFLLRPHPPYGLVREVLLDEGLALLAALLDHHGIHDRLDP
jgi:hypothetical protein